MVICKFKLFERRLWKLEFGNQIEFAKWLFKKACFINGPYTNCDVHDDNGEDTKTFGAHKIFCQDPSLHHILTRNRRVRSP